MLNISNPSVSLERAVERCALKVAERTGVIILKREAGEKYKQK